MSLSQLPTVNVILLDQLQWSTIGVVVCSFQHLLLFRCSVLLFQSCGCSSPATSLPSILCCFHVTTLTHIVLSESVIGQLVFPSLLWSY